jgi:hypothetical protein
MEKKPKVQKPKQDQFYTLKYKGYCRSQTPPDRDMQLDDFVRFAKNFLCVATGTLWKDPIWDTYTTEEILIEYYSHLYSKDEKFKKEFETALNMTDDTYAWLDKMVDKNQKEMGTKKEELPERVEYSPVDTLGE